MQVHRFIVRASHCAWTGLALLAGAACSQPAARPAAAVASTSSPALPTSATPVIPPARPVPAATAGAPATAAGAAAPSVSAAPLNPAPVTPPPAPSPNSQSPAGPSTPPAAVPPCPAPLSPGDHSESVQHEGRTRTYLMHVPARYDGRTRVPVVFDFHGYGSSGAGQSRLSGWQALGEREGFITVFPDGVGGSWNVNGCCAQAAAEKLDEIGFVRAVFAEVEQTACIDPQRIYASGISQGGGMAHHVACLAADLFTAVAPVSSDLRTEPCRPARPVSEISFRGLADAQSPVEGGEVGPPGMTYTSIGAEATFERWAEIAGCTDTPAMTGEYCRSHAACSGGATVTLCLLPGVGHVAYQNRLAFDIPATAWQSFQRTP